MKTSETLCFISFQQILLLGIADFCYIAAEIILFPSCMSKKPKSISIEDLRRAVAVVTHGSSKKAASVLNIGESTIVPSIRMAQKLTSVPLFNIRTNLKTSTKRGRIFAAEAAEIIKQFDKMVDKINERESPNEGTVRLHVSDLLMAGVALPALAKLSEQKDYKVNVMISITPAFEAIWALEGDESHLALILSERHQGSGDNPNIETIKEVESPLVALSKSDLRLPSDGNLLASRESISLAELIDANVQLALPPESYTIRRIVNNLRQGRIVKPVITINSISHLKHYVRMADVVTILPKVTAAIEIENFHMPAVPLSTPNSTRTYFSLYKHVNRPLSPAAKIIEGALKKSMLKLNSPKL